MEINREHESMEINREHLNKAFEQLKRKYSKFAEIELGEKIGDGSFSSVYKINGYSNSIVLKATDTSFCSYDAMINSEGKYEYAKQEIEIMKHCQDSNYVMPILGDTEYIVDEDNKHSIFLIVMPELKTLYSVMAEMNMYDTLQMMKDICRGLMICHKKHFLHRDVSLKNVFVEELVDGSRRYILGDFGVARYGIEKSYNNGWFAPVTKVGVAPAPEMLDGKSLNSYNSDIYSFGKMIERMTDREEFVCRNATLPEEMMNIIRKASEHNPKDRYRTADELLKDLESVDLSTAGKRKANTIVAYKTAILDGKRAYAEECLRREFLRGDTSGIRLYAYLLYGNYRRALKEFNKVKTAFESGDSKLTTADVGKEMHSADLALAKLEEALNKLAEISYKEDDIIASGLLAFIRFAMCENNDEKGRKLWFSNLKDSAENDCVFAQYYCGRWLLDGNVRYVDKDFDEGARIINMAFNHRYMPALIYIKKYLSENPDKNMLKDEPELIRALEFEIEDVPAKICQEALVEIL